MSWGILPEVRLGAPIKEPTLDATEVVDRDGAFVIVLLAVESDEREEDAEAEDLVPDADAELEASLVDDAAEEAAEDAADDAADDAAEEAEDAAEETDGPALLAEVGVSVGKASGDDDIVAE